MARLTERTRTLATKAFTGLNTAVYRATGGAVGGRWGDAGVLLLTTVGRKSGKRRTTPVLYLPDGERWIVVATNNGARRHPAWWLNLRAAGTGAVQVRWERFDVTATEVPEEERDELWPRLVDMYAGYARDAKRTERLIPVIALERVRTP